MSRMVSNEVETGKRMHGPNNQQSLDLNNQMQVVVFQQASSVANTLTSLLKQHITAHMQNRIYFTRQLSAGPLDHHQPPHGRVSGPCESEDPAQTNSVNLKTAN